MLKKQKLVKGVIMKSIFFLIVSLAVVLSAGCDNKKPSPAPSTTVEATTTIAPSPTTTVGQSCPQPSVGFVKCYDWGKCNGVFESIQLAVQWFQANDQGNSCLKMGDTVYKFGFGPCAECIAYTPAKSMLMSKVPKWDDVKATIGTDKSHVYQVGEKLK